MSLYAKRALVFCMVLVGVAWSYGAAAFLAADGSLTWTLPRQESPPEQAHNLAWFRFGPTLRASSFHRHDAAHHHPAFLIDGRAAPTLVEKWCSGILDKAPWIEISWGEPRQLSEVKIWHAGFREAAEHTLRRYRLGCLSAQEPAPSLQVTSNTNAIATHALPCRGARGLRIDWTPNVPGERARVYEVEVWGK
jgi:hypothetical protein